MERLALVLLKKYGHSTVDQLLGFLESIQKPEHPHIDEVLKKAILEMSLDELAVLLDNSGNPKSEVIGTIDGDIILRVLIRVVDELLKKTQK